MKQSEIKEVTIAALSFSTDINADENDRFLGGLMTFSYISDILPLIGVNWPDQKFQDSHHLHVQRPQPHEDPLAGKPLL